MPSTTELADVLRGAGCTVVEVSGWKTRGHSGTFTPKGVMLHHDASPVGPANGSKQAAMLANGRPGLDGPLCQLWIDYYGRWWVIAAGKAYHAGEGAGWGAIAADRGNELTLGVEMDNTTGELTLPAQYEALRKGLPALFEHFGWSPSTGLTAHKEYAKGRKPDPDDIDMPAMRAAVIAAMAPGAPGRITPDLGDDDLTPAQEAKLDYISKQVKVTDQHVVDYATESQRVILEALRGIPGVDTDALAQKLAALIPQSDPGAVLDELAERIANG